MNRSSAALTGSIFAALLAGLWLAAGPDPSAVMSVPELLGELHQAAPVAATPPDAGQSSPSAPTVVLPPTPTARPDVVELSRAARVIASGWESEADPAQAAFRAWAQRWLAGDRTPMALAEGVRLAGLRREFLRGLMTADPARVLEAAVPLRLRYQLPPEIVALLEARVDGVGRISRLAAKPVRGQTLAESGWMEARVGENFYRVHTADTSRKRSLGWAVLHGVAVGRELAVSGSPLRAAEAGELLGIGRPVAEVCPVSGKVTAAAPPSPAEAAEEAPEDVLDAGDSWVRVCNCPIASSGTWEQRLLARERAASPWIGGKMAAGTEGTPAFFSMRPAQAWTTGDKETLAIRVDFADVAGEPLTETEVSDIFNAANGVTPFFESSSYGRTSVQLAPAVAGDSPDITPVFRLPRTAADYAAAGDNDGLHQDARNLAALAGFAVDTYDLVGVYFDYIGGLPGSQITYGGLGEVEGKNYWINGSFDSGFVAHEIGHNYGLSHASRRKVAAGSSAVAEDGNYQEYGDEFDVMGDAYPPEGHFSMWAKTWMHWLDEAGTKVVTASGDYRVTRFDHPEGDPGNPAQPLALRIPRQNGAEYWVGHRRLFTSNADASNGAYITWGYDNGGNTRLIDCRTPSDNNSLNAPLPVGATFADTEAGVTFETLARGGAGAGEYLDIRITLSPRLDSGTSVAAVNEKSGTGQVMVRRVQSAGGAVSAAWATAPGTATSPADFTPAGGTLEWADGEVLPRLLPIPIAADAEADDRENFNIGFSALAGAAMFSSVNPLSVSIRQPGSFDPGFIRGPWIDATVRAVAQDAQGRVVVGGDFGDFGVHVSQRLGRLLAGGMQDTSFMPPPITRESVAVYALAVQPDGKILVGGDFAVTGGPSHFMRVQEDGSLDAGFAIGSGPNGPVKCVLLLPGGDILVAGEFTSFNGTPRNQIVRLNEDGTIDAAFTNPLLRQQAPYTTVNSMALQPDGKVVVGGYFFINPAPPYGWSLARLNLNGTVDDSFVTGHGIHAVPADGGTDSGDYVEAVAVLPGGGIAAAGPFRRYDSTTRQRFVVLTSTGAVDPAFNTGFGGRATGIHPLPDGRILVNGNFGATTGAEVISSKGLVLFNADGSLDTAFSATHDLENDVNALLVDAESGRLVAGGWFSSFEGNLSTPLFKLFSPIPGTGPVITTQPAGGTLAEGGGITLTVGVKATNPFCQWYRNDVPLPGATGLSLALTNAAAADAGSYVAKLVTPDGAAASSPAVVNVELMPVISQHPADLTVNLGQPAAFSVQAAGLGLGYQWQKGTTDLQGETGPVLTIPATLADSGGSYRCIVSNTHGSTPSNPATLVVITPPEITGHPAGVTRDSGQSATFSVTAEGLDLFYQWQKGTTDLTGRTTPTLVLNNLTTLDSGLYRCVVTNSAGSDISDPAELVVNGPPGFATHPENRLVNAGDTVNFSVTLTGAATSVQWLHNNAAIPGATGQTYTIPAVASIHPGDYVARLGTGMTSSPARLIVITPPANQKVLQNGTATFKLTPSQTTGVTYEWLSPQGGPLVASTRILGVGSATLVIKNCSLADEGDYICEVKAFTPEQTLTTAAVSLDVVSPPVVDAGFAPPAAIVGGAFTWQIVASEGPTKYAVTGLPAGLVLNATTGVVSGIPNAATTKPLTLNVTATNAGGTSVKQPFTFVVAPFPLRSQGPFSAHVAPDPVLNANLGGLITATVAANGTLTGTLKLGALSYPFTKRCTVSVGTSPEFSQTITRKGLTTLTVALVLDPGTDGMAGTVSDPGASAAVTGWRHVWNTKAKPATAFAGIYNSTAEVPDALASDATVPQGFGYTQTNVSTAGAITGAGRTPDGATFTLGGALWPGGEVPVWVLLYKNKGSLQGQQLLVSDATPPLFPGNTLGGTLRLVKTGPAAATERAYKPGFAPVVLEMAGEKWVKPSAARLLFGVTDTGVNNANVDFTPDLGPGPVMSLATEGDVDQPFRITSTHTAKLATSGGVDNPKKVVLTLTAATGLFSGSFTLVDTVGTAKVTRTVPIAGILRRDQGWGYYLLPELPVPPAAAATTPIWSGRLEIKAGP